MRKVFALFIMISLSGLSCSTLQHVGKTVHRRALPSVFTTRRRFALYFSSGSSSKNIVYPSSNKVNTFNSGMLGFQVTSMLVQKNFNDRRVYATKDKDQEKKEAAIDNTMLSEMNFNKVEFPTFDNIKFVEDDKEDLQGSEVEEEDLDIENEDTPKKTKKRIKAIRQHVNPLSAYYQLPIQLDKDWIKKAYKDPTLPFHIDIGCARGQFCIGMALLNRNVNYLGLEIRRPCVNEANLKLHEKKSTDLTNVHFLASNANIDLETIVKDIQREANSHVETISIQFPDPHFKKKHRKRRVVQPELVETIAKSLAYTKAGSNENVNKLFIQSDVLEVIQEMRYSFRNCTILKDTVEDFDEWLPSNPMDVLTEREKLVLRQDLPVYRTIFEVDRSNEKESLN